MASSTGPQWSLYPLLAILSFCTFSLSGGHIFFCLPFFFLFLPFISGIICLLTAFHAIFLRFPNRTDFVLQVFASIVSSFFFFSSSLETFCLSKDKDDTSGDICKGIEYRTNRSVNGCESFLQPFQSVVLTHTNWKLNPVRVGLSSGLTVLAISQLLITTILSFYSAHETKLRIRVHHYQIVLGIILIVVSLFHWRYCCLFYFISIPFLSGILSIIQGITTWMKPSNISRGLDILGAAMSLSLFSSILFSLLCCISRIFDIDLPILRHCNQGESRIKDCRRVLHFSIPYYYWEQHQIDHEVTTIQIIIYIVLTILSLFYFYFSIKGTFKIRHGKTPNVFFEK